MKKIVSLITVFILITALFVPTVLADAPKGLKSSSILMIDTSSSRAIYSKNSTDKIAPGGFTKILTAVIVLENISDINSIVTADANTIASCDFSYGNMGLLANEQMSVKNLLYGMLLYDAAEAAQVLATYTFGNYESFIEAMNNKAKELGCTKSSFTNAGGYPDDKQYSTLEDMALIAQYAMQNDTFREITSTANIEIAPTNKYTSSRHLNNTNKFVCPYVSKDYYDENASGVKTSYNSDSDCGLITCYNINGIEFMFLSSGSPYDGIYNYSYEDAKKLIEYAKTYYKTVKVISKEEIIDEIPVKNAKGTNRLLLVAAEDVYANLPEDYDEELLETKCESEKTVKAPISKGDAYGVVSVFYDGELYAKSHLIASESLKKAPLKGAFMSFLGIFTSTPFKVIVLTIIILYVSFTLWVNHLKRKRRKLKRLKQRQAEIERQNDKYYY